RSLATARFARPVPRMLCPTKYDAAAAALGTPSTETNMGVGTDDLRETVGWTGALGAAPGIVADMWIEFWWASFLVLLCIGWCHGRAVAGAVGQGRVRAPLHRSRFDVS